MVWQAIFRDMLLSESLMPAALEANTIFVRSEIKIIPEPLPISDV
jgi:hypothetical protein